MLPQLLMLMFGPLAMPHNLPDRALPETVSPLTVSGQKKDAPADAKLQMNGSDADASLVGIWPAEAYHIHIDGYVRLKCLIDTHGLAEKCTVAREQPAGKGFGKAALEMRAVIKLPPSKGPEGPVAGYKIIDVGFKAPDPRIDLAHLAQWQFGPGSVPLASTDVNDFTRGSRNAVPMRAVTMMDNPVWIAAASFDDLAHAYPAKGGGGEGYAVAHCKVLPTGDLEACQTIKEEPEGRDFGRAAIGLAAKFKLDPKAVARAPRRDQLWVDVPIRYPAASELAERTVTSPSWVQVFDTITAPKLFPPEAVAAGLTTGRGVVRCVVGADGTLTGCAPEPADPDGLGFSEAVVRLASTMKMNLWSADAVPVAGGVVHVPIRLNLKATGG
jgi:hypothetical protein